MHRCVYIYAHKYVYIYISHMYIAEILTSLDLPIMLFASMPATSGIVKLRMLSVPLSVSRLQV